MEENATWIRAAFSLHERQCRFTKANVGRNFFRGALFCRGTWKNRAAGFGGPNQD
jgi:hypothetical protein